MYYFDEEELEGAKKQIEFLEDRIKNMVAKKITEEEKQKKIQRIRQTITAIEYYYSIC
tara:strand:- start:16 stop:189 length:174 start_codon:yes stop_codon:yes gene_type:complete